MNNKILNWVLGFLKLQAVRLKNMICLEVILAAVPLLIGVLGNGRDLIFQSAQMNLEKYLPVILSGQLEEDTPLEAMMTQAVITRTNGIYGGLGACIADTKMPSFPEVLWSDCDISYQKAQEKTEGKILLESETQRLCRLPYCWLSAGKTRSGEEILGADYQYLSSVESKMDRSADHYQTKKVLTAKKIKKKMEKKYENQLFTENIASNIEILSRDSSGYVKEIRLEAMTMNGEEFCRLFDLPSSNFELQKKKKKITIITKGVGHGFGYSQYGGRQLAEDGKTFREILLYYFPKMKLSEIE